MIRPAGPDDLADIRALLHAYAAGLGVDLAYQGFDAELAGLPGRYAPPRGALLIARDAAGAPVGCAALRPLDPPGRAEMKRLYVAPAARGTGLGEALARAVIDAARAAGHAALVLDTLPGMAAAQALYRRLGFAPTAPHYPTPVAGTVFLGLDLTRAAPPPAPAGR